MVNKEKFNLVLLAWFFSSWPPGGGSASRPSGRRVCFRPQGHDEPGLRGGRCSLYQQRCRFGILDLFSMILVVFTWRGRWFYVKWQEAGGQPVPGGFGSVCLIIGPRRHGSLVMNVWGSWFCSLNGPISRTIWTVFDFASGAFLPLLSAVLLGSPTGTVSDGFPENYTLLGLLPAFWVTGTSSEFYLYWSFEPRAEHVNECK